MDTKLALKILCVLLLFFGRFCASAQTPANLTANSPYNLFLKEIEKHAVMDREEFVQKTEGSPFLNEEFTEGEVITERGTFNPLRMRYNVYTDAIQFDLGNQMLYLDPQPLIKQVKLNGMTFKVKEYPFQSAVRRGFLEELAVGRYSLYAKKNISLRKAEPPKALQSEGTPPKLIMLSDTYFLEMPDDELVKVKDLKDVLSQLDGAEEIKDFIKKEKLSNKKQEDLVRLVNFINANP